MRWLLRMLYGFRSFNVEALNTPGPVLLIPNHLSWLDWLFVGIYLDEDWRFVTSSITAQTTWLHRWIMINRRTFPINTASPYAAKRMAEYLQNGGRLVLFAEGRMTMTGSLMKLYEGTGFLLHKTNARVITCYLRNVQRIPWVRHKGWTQWFPRLSAHYSPAHTPPQFPGASTAEARQRLTLWLDDLLIRQQFETEMELGESTVLEAVVSMARQRPRHFVMEDVLNRPLRYGQLMLGVDMLSRQWCRWLANGTRYVGLLMPNANVTPITLLSLWANGRIPAILNYSSGSTTMINCANLAGLKEVITSRAFLEKAKLDAEPWNKAGIKLVYMEDVKAGISLVQKVGGMMRNCFKMYPTGPDQKENDPALVLFTSGSEGAPKGVELTHHNILSNIRQMLSVVDLRDNDKLFNALPMFHSFGLTIGTLLPLVRGCSVFVYPSPLHYRVIPTMVYDRNCTIMLATNTFLNGYARKANPYDFYSVRYLFAGAEKIQESTCNLWARKFGVRVLEGYGATECSPCISVNTPRQPRFGTAGRFMPGMEYRIHPIEGLTEGGRLWVRGPNIMGRYLNADADARFQAMEGWYDTGDIARVSPDGYVEILGRLKRFAKISGEMVSLTAVEDALAGMFRHISLKCEVAILSRPDPDKGEALIAVTNEPHLNLDSIRNLLREKGFSNLCIPREILQVKEMPKLGTGKADYRALQTLLAKELNQVG